MTKMISLCLGIFMIPLSGQSQTNTTQLPNGVIVHQAEGVEGTPEKKSEQVVVRTMNDWSLPECIDALHVLELKLAEATLSEDKERYQRDKVQLVKRINELKQAN